MLLPTIGKLSFLVASAMQKLSNNYRFYCSLIVLSKTRRTRRPYTSRWVLCALPN